MSVLSAAALISNRRSLSERARTCQVSGRPFLTMLKKPSFEQTHITASHIWTAGPKTDVRSGKNRQSLDKKRKAQTRCAALYYTRRTEVQTQIPVREKNTNMARAVPEIPIERR